MGLLSKRGAKLDKEIEDLDAKLATLDPHTQGAEYEQLLKIRGLLVEQVEKGYCSLIKEAEYDNLVAEKPAERWISKIDPNTVLKLVGTLGIAGAIMLFEAYGHAFTSKASSLMPKLL